jgi:hypothetical protein
MAEKDDAEPKKPQLQDAVPTQKPVGPPNREIRGGQDYEDFLPGRSGPVKSGDDGE